MKKLLCLLLLAFLYCGQSFAAVELREEGTRVGVVEEINVVGSTITATKSNGLGVITVTNPASSGIAGDGTAEISGMLADIEVGVTNDIVTVAESGRIFVCTANSVKTLPTAADGLIYNFVDGAGCTITIDTGVTTDTIEYLTLDAGDTIDSPGAAGDSVTVVGDGTNNKWYVVHMKGTWTDGGST